MSDARTPLRSFAAGEITPEMFGRLDLTKFQTGLARCFNFVSLPYGPVENRAGFRHVTETRASATRSRLIPFIFNADQAFVLELGHQYIRFHLNGTTLTETEQTIESITTGLTTTVTLTGHGYVTGDCVFVENTDPFTRFTSRQLRIIKVDDDNFRLVEMDGSTEINSSSVVITTEGTVARVYQITTAYNEADLFGIKYAQSNDVLTLTHVGYPVYEVRRLGTTNWTITAHSFNPQLTPPTNCNAVATVGSGGITYVYAVTAVSDTGEESLLSNTDAQANDLYVAGNYTTITWDAVSGASRYKVYKQRNGYGLFGYIGEPSGTTFIDDNIIADTSRTPPEYQAYFSFAGDRPGAVGYYDQRKVFAGSTNSPQTFWISRPGTEGNLTSSIPSRDDDAIVYTLASRQQNRVLHVVTLSSLIFLTSGAEYKVTSGGDVVSPNTLSARPFSYVGANLAQPVLTDSAILFASANSGNIREIKYKLEQDNFVTENASLMAPHLFKGHTVVDLTFTKSPVPVMWGVRDDGVLLGMTFVPDQDVRGWHQHATAFGAFESVCAIPENGDDVLYAIVRRDGYASDGVTEITRRFVECLRPRTFSTQADAFFVDSGLTYEGAAVSEVKGLWHLEGLEVSILADGAVHPSQVVSAGSVSLEAEATKVHVGLPITAEIKTLPLMVETAAAFGQAMNKNVSAAYLRVLESGSIFVGPSLTELREFRQRTNEPYGSPPRLYSGWADVGLSPEWQKDAAVWVQQTRPLPITVSALVVEEAVGG